MYRNKFLDSWDEKSFELLIFLNNNSNNRSKEACSSFLGVSPKTLAKICDSLTEIAEATGFFELINSQNRLQVRLQSQTNLTNIFFYMLSRSVKWNLISNLFNETELNTVRLEADLGISHATLYRKLDDLNEILADFKLKVTNLELRGSEMQIRHFFVEYCVTTIPYKVTHQNLYNEKIAAGIELFEKHFELQLDTDAKLKMIVYLNIIKKRYEQGKINAQQLHNEAPFFENDCDRDAQTRFVEQYQNSLLDLNVQEYLKEINDLFKIELVADESILLVLFMMGHDILPTTSTIFNSILNLEEEVNTPIKSMTEEVLGELHKHDLIDQDNFILEKEVGDLLNIISWNQAVYYGGIYMYAELSFNKLIDFKKFAPVKNYILNFFVDSYPEFKNEELQSRRFIVNLLLVFLYAADQSSHSYKVGVKVKGDVMYRMLIQKQIINRINSLEYASAESFDSETDYDLIVSNVDLPEFHQPNHQFYLLNHQFTPHDFTMLEQMIAENAEIKKTQ